MNYISFPQGFQLFNPDLSITDYSIRTGFNPPDSIQDHQTVQSRLTESVQKIELDIELIEAK